MDQFLATALSLADSTLGRWLLVLALCGVVAYLFAARGKRIAVTLAVFSLFAFAMVFVGENTIFPEQYFGFAVLTAAFLLWFLFVFVANAWHARREDRRHA